MRDLDAARGDARWEAHKLKFVCDNCKAKYQIGDDKVAGKTLRMKCRRCGHMIQVAATVTESSVSQKLPTEPAAGSAPVAPRHPTPAPMAPLDPRSPADTSGDDGATVVKPSPLFLFQNSSKPAAPAPAPSVAGAPRPGGPRIVPPARASLRSAPPGALPNAPIGAASPGPSGAAMAAHSPSAPGLYGGFARAVAVPQPAAQQPADPPLPTEDWYVGIGGVPLGPVRLSVLRDKAAANQVDAESLVWREGFDEWVPVKSFPALLSLVDEARQTRMSRTSMPAVTPPPAPIHTPAAPPARPAPGAGAGLGLAASPNPAIVIPDAAPSLPFDLVRQSSHPIGAPAPSPRPDVVADPFGAAASTGAAAAASADVVADPFNPRTSQLGGTPAFSAATERSAIPPGATANGSANGAAGYGLTTTVGVTAPSEVAPRASSPPPKAKKSVSPAVIAFIAMAATFGGVAAWALFFRSGPKVIYLPGEQPPPSAQQPQLGNAPPPPPTSTGTAEVVETATPSSTVGGPVGVGGGPRPTGTVKPGETAPPLDTSSFNMGGPGPVSTGGTPSGGGSLTEGQISGVVSSNTARVRRKCWDQAVAGRASDAPSSVKVTARLKIAPSGSVSSASASGGNEKYYPGLVSCVQATVQGWKFPASDGGGEAVVPFSFNAQ